jgi:hypothetical protein
MRYKWEQKYSNQPEWHWSLVAESDNLWELIKQANSQTFTLSVSGKGERHIQNKVSCIATGKTYSIRLGKNECLQLMAYDIAAEAIDETQGE